MDDGFKNDLRSAAVGVGGALLIFGSPILFSELSGPVFGIVIGVVFLILAMIVAKIMIGGM